MCRFKSGYAHSGKAHSEGHWFGIPEVVGSSPSAGLMEYRDYPARLDRVVDGDTIDVVADLGFRTHKSIRVRVKGIDTNEVYGVAKDTEEYAIGKEQSEFAESFFTGEDEWSLILRVFGEETGKYGRWLGDICVDGEWYTDAIEEEWPSVSI